MRKSTDSIRLAAYLFGVTSTFGFLQPFVPLYMEAAGLSRAQIGLVTGFGTGLAILIQPLLGKLSDRFDSRRPFIFGSALLAGIAYLSFPHAQGILAFLTLIALGGNGIVYLQTAGGVLVGRMVAAEKGGAAYAGMRVWGSVGYIVTSLLSGWLVGSRAAGRSGLDIVFYTGPLLFFAVATLAWFLPDARREAGMPKSGKAAPLDPNLRRFLIAYFLYILALYGASGYLSLYLKSLGASGPWITGTFAAGVVVEVLVMRWSGRFSDRFGRRPALAFAFALLPLRLLLYVPATGPLWVLLVQTLHGINFGIVGAVSIAFVNDVSDDRTRGHAQARLAAVAGLATAVGPVLFGEAAQRLGLSHMFLVAAAVAAAAAAVLVWGVHDSHPESSAISDQGPAWLRPWMKWLDAPPRRRDR